MSCVQQESQHFIQLLHACEQCPYLKNGTEKNIKKYVLKIQKDITNIDFLIK